MNTPSMTSYNDHPCFGADSRRRAGRLHLPAASKSCLRLKYGAPAVPHQGPCQALSPTDALNLLEQTLESGVQVDVVGITGPGDPLASPETTLDILRRVREAYPDMAVCLTTCGLNAAEHAEALAGIGMSHITVMVDAVKPEIAERLYAWIRPGTKTLRLDKGAEILVASQAESIAAFKKAGLKVKVDTVVYPGINDEHVEFIAQTVAELGADIMGLKPFVPSAAAGEEETGTPPEPTSELMRDLREQVSARIRVMPSFKGCGRDVVGFDTPPIASDSMPASMSCAPGMLPKPSGERTRVAAASSDGMEVDTHLGHARAFLIYGPREEDGLPCLLETRPAPPPGSGDRRWHELSDILFDCFALLASGAGERPRTVLGERGLRVLVVEDDVEGLADVLFGGGKKGCGKGKK